MLKMSFIGVDGWSRPVYRDNKRRLWKDVNLGRGTIDLHKSTNNDFDGEPDYRIQDEYEIIKGMEE